MNLVRQIKYYTMVLLLISTTLSYAQVSSIEEGIISTLAGKGMLAPGFAGDGGAASNSLLNNPASLAVDNSGNVYISDMLNNRIRKVTRSTGIITTIAGTGVAGFSGDGGAASAAQLNYPSDICVDMSSANIYFFDSLNYRIRKINLSTSIISTVAGYGSGGYTGQTMPALNAGISGVSGLAGLYRDYLFVSLGSLGKVCEIDMTTGTIFTFAGTGTTGFSGDGGPAVNAVFNYPAGLSMDSNGIMYVADFLNQRVRKIDTTGIISTLAGNGLAGFSGDTGPAISASLNFPQSISVTSTGMLYIADRGNHRIRQVNMKIGKIYTNVGSGVAGYEGDGFFANTSWVKLFNPACIRATTSGNLYIADLSNNCIRKVNSTLKVSINSTYGTPIDTLVFCGGSFTINTEWSVSISPNLVSLISIQYKVNDVPVSNNGTTLLYSPVSGDVVTAEFLFGTSCGNIVIVSNAVTVTTPPPASPGITLIPTYDSCGTSVMVTFTAVLVDEGARPICNCRNTNGSFVLITSSHTPSFSTNAADGDQFYCLLTSSTKCKPRPTEVSNVITIRHYPLVTPAVAIAASSTSICAGQSVIFTATASNGGTSPLYQWQVNGVNAGTGLSFTSANLNNNDTVSCILSADATLPCTTSRTARSNKIKMNVGTGSASASVSITASGNNICENDLVTFTATTQNAGSAVSYQWQVNGAPAGTNNPVYSSNRLMNGDKISCIISATTSGCFAPVTSNIIVMAVRRSPVLTLTADSTLINPGSKVQLTVQLTGTIASYVWSPANLLVNPLTLTPVSRPITAATAFSIQVTNTEGCAASAGLLIQVRRPLLMPSVFTPNGDGKNDLFRIPPGALISLSDFSIYNRWGEKIFTTSDVAKGWDGKVAGLEQQSDVFIYSVRGIAEGKPVVIRGTFILIR